jgi:hypothetical protein
VMTLIDELPEWNRPSRRIRDLPGGRRIFVSISDGASVIAAQGGGPFRIDGAGGIVVEGQRGLILKLLEPTRKALGQLYADPVPEEYWRLLFVRWKPPEQFVATPEGLEEVRKNIQERVRSFVSPSFARFAIVIAHTDEHAEQMPRAAWG